MSKRISAKFGSELFRLDGKIVLITGGAGIIGNQIAQALARAGAVVIIAARHVKKCEALAKQLQGMGLAAESGELDLTKEISIQRLRDGILKQYGRLDVLINNAVARAGGDLRNSTVANWEVTLRVNAIGLFSACRIFSEPMQAARTGSIINIASIYGIVGANFSIYKGTSLTNPVNYTFAKGGMISLTRYLASYLAPYQVRVNCLSPGGFKTPETPTEFVSNYLQHVPMGRMLEPGDIDGPLVFLASDASRYVTGQNIAVDGGWTAI